MIASAPQAEARGEVRALFRQKRAQVSAEERKIAEAQIVRHFNRMRSGVCWLLYAALKEEISTRHIFDLARSRGDKVFFPRVIPKGLEFRAVDEWDRLKQGALTLEPPSHATEWDSNRPTVIIVPGVAFDREGSRLGMGQGYYDRFLATHRRFPRLALAFDCQVATSTAWIPEPHDQKMDYVLTPRSVWGSPRVLI